MSAYMLTEEYRQYVRQFYNNGGRGYVSVKGVDKQPASYQHYLNLIAEQKAYRNVNGFSYRA